MERYAHAVGGVPLPRERLNAASPGLPQTIKYGTISVDALCQDMLDWETLYISGRTQKPVCSGFIHMTELKI